jgi:hypothetical protein
MLLRITLRSACFGAVVDDATGRCVRVAPLGRWMLGHAPQVIVRWVASKGGTVERLW